MIQGRRGLRFTLKSGEDLRIAGYVLWDKLKSNKTVKASVLGFVDDAHAATAKFFKYAVVGDGLPD